MRVSLKLACIPHLACVEALEAALVLFLHAVLAILLNSSVLSYAAPRPFGSRVSAREFDVHSLDYSKKVLHYTWHPRENIIAVAGVNNLYIYNAY